MVLALGIVGALIAGKLLADVVIAHPLVGFLMIPVATGTLTMALRSSAREDAREAVDVALRRQAIRAELAKLDAPASPISRPTRQRVAGRKWT